MNSESLDGEAIKRLRALIASVDDQIKQQPPANFTGNVERRRYVGLQITLAEFFRSIGCKGLESELYLLATAIDDLEFGIVHPALAPKKNPKGGRAPDSSQTWLARAGMAAAAKCFLLANLERKNAGKLFDKARTEMARLVRPSTNLIDAPFNWLRDFECGKVSGLPNGAWVGYVKRIEEYKQAGRPTDSDWIAVGNDFLRIACKQAARLVK